MPESTFDPTKIYEALVAHFDETDLEELCLRLTQVLRPTYADQADDFNYDNIKGANKRATALTLIRRCRHFSELETLAELIKEERPTCDLGEAKRTKLSGDSRHIMCDRTDQMRQFRGFFVQSLYSHPGLPHAYIVHGDAGQCHSSFVRRLELEKIKPYAESSKGVQTGAVKHLKFSTEFVNDLEVFQKDMQFGLFEEVSPNYNPMRTSARDLRAHGELKRFTHVIVEHVWEVSEPSDRLQEAVRWYLETYWAEVEADADKPQVLVFLSFVYPTSGPPLLRQLRPSNNPGKERFKTFLRDLHASVRGSYPCLLFDELVHPEQQEICKTLNQLGFHDEEDCPDWLKRLYKKKRGRVTMADIERQLKGPKPEPPATGWLGRWWPSR
jgi:hypothetical protein